MPDGHLHFLFGKMSIRFLCPFLNWVVRFFDVELYELRTDSLEKTLMLGKIEGKRRRGQKRMK